MKPNDPSDRYDGDGFGSTEEAAGCEEYRERLVPYLDGELPGEEEDDLECHVAACRECERVLTLHRQVGEILDAHLQADRRAPEGTPSSTLSSVRRRLAGGRRVRRWLVTASAAALLVAATLLGGFWLGDSSRQEEEDRLIIRNLDLLEEIHEEAGEVSPEFVQLLLEDVETPEELDPAIFDYLLEEEVASENL